LALGAAYFESQLIDYDVCSNWEIGLIWRELEMIQSTVISTENKRDYDKDRSFRDLWLQ
jgi:deoxyribodipyrimidine photo-lyase